MTLSTNDGIRHHGALDPVWPHALVADAVEEDGQSVAEAARSGF